MDKKTNYKMFTRRFFLLTGSFFVLNTLSGCISGAAHSRDLGSAQERSMTLGLVQKHLRKGQSQADVATFLGSPNLVTMDRNDNETWVYDKIATEASYSASGLGLGAGALGAGVAQSLALGGYGGSYSRNAGAASSTQRTLTVVIKFDQNNVVESFSYHSSKF
jgi:F0F1-type ATP synthase membrane subunit c/vacuolar-type H+-ATPase subunit K